MSARRRSARRSTRLRATRATLKRRPPGRTSAYDISPQLAVGEMVERQGQFRAPLRRRACSGRRGALFPARMRERIRRDDFSAGNTPMRLQINDKEHVVDGVDESTPLLWVLRDHLGLVGTK